MPTKTVVVVVVCGCGGCRRCQRHRRRSQQQRHREQCTQRWVYEQKKEGDWDLLSWTKGLWNFKLGCQKLLKGLTLRG